MILNHNHKLITVVLTVLIITGVGMFPLSGVKSILFPDSIFGIPAASANPNLGILGQVAPELALNTWIDGNGKKTGPIRLSGYRGKVVYLYFFQDW